MGGMILACGGCTDALIETKVWEVGLLPALLLGLLAEGALFAVVTWVRRMESTSPRAVPAAISSGLFVLALFTGAGAVLGATVAALILLGAAGWSLSRNYRFSPPLTWLRVAVLGVAVVVGSWRAWPGHRATGDLLAIALVATPLRATDGWLFDELRSRPDSVPGLERLAEGPRKGDEALVQLHFTLNGSHEFRRATCERWRITSPRLAEACR